MGIIIEALLVALTCAYQIGCSDTATAYYQSNPELQRSAQYAEYQVKKHFSKSQLLTTSVIVNSITGREFTVPLTARLSLKGHIKWGDTQQYTLLYSWPL